MPTTDCFWTQGYKGGFIHHKCVNRISQYEYQIAGEVRPAKSFRSAQILITRAQQHSRGI